MASSRTPWERFIALPEDDRRELVAGKLVDIEGSSSRRKSQLPALMTTESHERIVAMLTFFFVAWVREHGGAAYASGYKVRIDDAHCFMPDVQLYHPKNRAERAPQALASGAPDIVVEVLSEGSATYDKRAKLLGYARIGVTEYWVVSPDEGSVERLVLRRGKYVVEEVLVNGDTLAPSRFPGLEVPVSELFTPEAPRKSKR